MSIRIDSRFLSVVVHDLRNPLNVIGLSLRMIEDELPEIGCEMAREDLGIVRENVLQLTTMLSHLGDFARLVDSPSNVPSRATFDPQHLVHEAVDEFHSHSSASHASIRLERGPDCPATVTLDPVRSRVALRYALSNAVSSAGSAPIRVVLDGVEDRLRVDVIVDAAPRSTVQSTVLSSDQFERLLGNDAERRGLDLALVARVSEILGGSARLEIRSNESSSIIMEWACQP